MGQPARRRMLLVIWLVPLAHRAPSNSLAVTAVKAPVAVSAWWSRLFSLTLASHPTSSPRTRRRRPKRPAGKQPRINAFDATPSDDEHPACRVPPVAARLCPAWERPTDQSGPPWMRSATHGRFQGSAVASVAYTRSPNIPVQVSLPYVSLPTLIHRAAAMVLTVLTFKRA
eukprot:CAMPEP_0181029598 /NCGR_PEP_ID=MMETSP1070-20121207/5280_1 /TAXON_ID=265543 /ORGANISM="Minutocellus polymorphus, Strain NH13" /LENGTH=170 /DNA_ID=CAMNT_0023106911 /DNA_START=428 /DNA_END=935 /DNA_ORIENTATION=-